MKRKLILATVIIALCAVATDAFGYTFSAVSPSGHTLYYNYYSNSAGGYVEVTFPSHNSSYPYYGHTAPSGDLIIPDSVVYNGATIPVISIGEAAFRGCNELTSCSIPNTIFRIVRYAFMGCNRLNVNVPNSVTEIWGSAFDRVKHLEYHGTSVGAPWGAEFMNGIHEGDFILSAPNRDTLICYTGQGGSISIPPTVTFISHHTFSYGSQVTNCTIPNSVTGIGDSAFFQYLSVGGPVYLLSNNRIKFLTIPDNVTHIGTNAFLSVLHINYHGTATGAPWGAAHMNMVVDGDFIFSNPQKDTLLYYTGNADSVTIPSTVVHIGEYAFSYHTELSSVNLPNSIVSIGRCAFIGLTSLSSINLPNSLVEIGDFAFGGCTSLSSINLPNSLVSIGNYAFNHCTALSSIGLPNSIASIGDSAFYGCTALSSINLPNSIVRIGDFAFCGCTALSSISLPNSFTGNAPSIGRYAFAYCGLSSIILPNTDIFIGANVFYGCTRLHKIVVPTRIRSIDYYAFYGIDTIYYRGSATGSPWGALHHFNYYVDNGVYYNDLDTKTMVIGCDTALTSVYLPNSVIEIAPRAFADHTQLHSVRLPDSLLYTIKAGTFANCTNLDSIVLPQFTQSIGDSAFIGCGLTHIDIAHVSNIGHRVFANNNRLRSVVFSTDSVTLGDEVFSNCINLRRVHIPDTIKMNYYYNLVRDIIPYGIFMGCTNLDSVVLPNSITTIGGSAFSGCSQLRSIVLPNSITTIGDQAFYRTSLTSITIPSTVRTIGSEAFRWCELSSVTFATPNNRNSLYIQTRAFYGNQFDSITIPHHVSRLGGATFSGNRRLQKVNFNATNCTNAGTTNMMVEFPSSVTTVNVGNGVKVLPACLFMGCENLRRVNFADDSLITIGEKTFAACTSLPSITIPNSVQTIGNEAFNGCTSLRTVHFNADSCRSMGSYNYPAFNGCTNLRTVVIGDGVRYVPPFAFYHSTIDSISFGANVSTIGNSAFMGCSNITSLQLPPSLKRIKTYAFGSLTALTTLVIPDNVEEIGSDAFNGCNGLTTVTIGEGLVDDNFGFVNCPNIHTLNYNAKNAYFTWHHTCDGLRTLNIGRNVESIQSGAFEDCTFITSINFPTDNHVKYIGQSTFSGCSNMMGHIVLPRITTLYDSAFYDCGLISSVELGDALTQIESGTFSNCDHLTNITLGRGITNVATDAFTGCTEVQLLTSRALNPPIVYSGTFASMNENITVRVPCSAVNAYTYAPFWSHFSNISGQFEWLFSATSGDITKGGVTIVDAPSCNNIQAQILATPYHGYKFVNWNDGNTQNPRFIVVTQDTMLVATFEATTGISPTDEEANSYSIRTDRHQIIVDGYVDGDIRVYDISGRLVYARKRDTSITETRIKVSSPGVYMVNIGNLLTQKVVIVK